MLAVYGAHCDEVSTSSSVIVPSQPDGSPVVFGRVVGHEENLAARNDGVGDRCHTDCGEFPRLRPADERKTMANRTLLHDIWDFLRVRKAWWLLPIVIVLILMGVLVIAAQVPYLAPFIYALF